jgi:hypothetical protein
MVVSLTLAPISFGQADFVEQFDNNGPTNPVDDGPANLVAEGWIFHNQSEPLGTSDWFEGVVWPNLIEPHGGTGFIGADFNNVDNFGTISNWAVLPEVIGQTAGDVMTFYTISGSTGHPDRLQVRYSPSQGTDTGSDANDTGDFDVLLLDIDPVPNYNSGPYNGWTRHEISLPGDGRLAFRYFVTDAGIWGSNATYLGIDTLTIAPPAPTPAPLPQNFEDGLPELVEQGWTFINQSDPTGGGTGWNWENTGVGAPFPAHLGIGYIRSSTMSTGPFGTASNWAILPEIDDVQAGDDLTFFVQTGSHLQDIHLQVRRSPSGGTDTGSGAEDVGDFTDLLMELNPPPVNGAWNLVRVTLPGPGRLALRYYVPLALPFTPIGVVGIDTMGINEDLPGPPIPAAGETVTWTVAGSPYVLESDVAIPAGGTVVVEPGVHIQIDPDVTLLVDGEMVAQGTAGQPISIEAGTSLVHPPVHVFGTLELDFGAVTGRIHGDSGGSVLISNSIFTQGVVSTQESSIFHEPQYVQIDQCSFTEGSDVRVIDGTLVIRDTTFQDASPPEIPFEGSLLVLRGYLHLDNVSLDGGQLTHIRGESPQTAYLNNLTVLNNSDRPALELHGWNFMLGADNLIQGNLYPVRLRAGLEPGSFVPATGNLNNFILNGENLPGDGLAFAGVVGGSTWPELGVPYLIHGLQTSGQLTIQPGVTVKLTPGSSIIAEGNRRLSFEGLPDQPITFQRFDPNGPWGEIAFQSNGTGPKLEHCIIEGSEFGAVAQDTLLGIESCVLRDNGIGSVSSTFGVSRIRKTLITNNVIGVRETGAPVSSGSPDLFGLTKPNAIEGNGQGVQALNVTQPVEARHNWWGDPSGPTHPSNPGGSGDSVDDTVVFSPFRTSPPDFSDTPPIVRLANPSFLSESGEKIIVRWHAEDDGAITSQQVLISEHGPYNYELLAELPPSQRVFEFTVPIVEPSSITGPTFIRVEAVDDAGQEVWDHVSTHVPYVEDVTGTITITSGFSGPFVPGQKVPVCWNTDGGPSGGIDATLLLDSDGAGVSLGGAHTGVDCLGLDLTMPYVSTDRARIALVRTLGAGGREVWAFSDYFEIRPDARIGDLPPTVDLLTPRPGDSFVGGTVVSIAWSASDDDAVRSLDIQASFDGGRTWHTIAEDLPGSATGFDWLLPPSTGIADVRVRVIARDLRFQNSADGDQVVFSITPGDGAPTGDLNGDGTVGPADLAILLGSWGPCDGCPADLDGDGIVDAADLAILLGNWG